MKITLELSKEEERALTYAAVRWGFKDPESFVGRVISAIGYGGKVRINKGRRSGEPCLSFDEDEGNNPEFYLETETLDEVESRFPGIEPLKRPSASD